MTAHEEVETVRVKVCECGAEYTTPGVARVHRCALNAGGPGTFRTVKRTRPKRPTRITYAPGYGPEAGR